MKICGPKMSLCGIIISIWGVIQLAIMGIFFQIQSVSMVEDLHIHNENFDSAEEFYELADGAYHQNAYNCWIAAFLYLLTLLLSLQQFNANNAKKRASGCECV